MSNPMSRRQWLKGFVAGLFGLRAALTPASAAASVPPVVPPPPGVPAHAGLAVCEGSRGIRNRTVWGHTSIPVGSRVRR